MNLKLSKRPRYNMFNPEKAFIEKNSPKQEQLTSKEELVYDSYVTKYKRQEPKLKEFSDVYSEQEINIDQQRLDKLKKDHIEKTERAEILEAVLAEQIEKANWLGEDCYIIQTSEYDDVINHTDLVAEFRDKNETIRIAIDVTTSEDNSVLDKKTDYIKKEIDKGKIADIKYYLFKEDEPQVKGKTEMDARVIIGTDKKGVMGVSELVAKVVKKEKGSNKELANFYMQIDFLEEIEEQLEYYINYAKSNYHTDASPVVKKQAKALKLISKILENKKRSLSLPQQAPKSEVYEYLTGLNG